MDTMSSTAGFDALASMTFDEMPVGEEYASYVPPIVMPDPEAAVQEKPQLPPRERIKALLRGMPGQEKTVLHVIDFCREERTVAQIAEEVERFGGGTVSVYSPQTICANMERAGALLLVDHASTAGEEEPSKEECGYLQAVPSVDFGYKASAEALEILEEDDPAQRIAQFIDEDSRYMPVYAILLEACLADGGLTKKKVDELIDKHPLCVKPRVYSGRFVKKLEAVDALSFDGCWHTTEAGEELLRSLA